VPTCCEFPEKAINGVLLDMLAAVARKAIPIVPDSWPGLFVFGMTEVQRACRQANGRAGHWRSNHHHEYQHGGEEPKSHHAEREQPICQHHDVTPARRRLAFIMEVLRQAIPRSAAWADGLFSSRRDRGSIRSAAPRIIPGGGRKLDLLERHLR
jgi:hypothetical protein